MNKKNNLETFQLGDVVRDTVSGYEGVVTSKTEWLNGCVRLGVYAKSLNKEGLPTEGAVIDVQQLELVKPDVVAKGRAGGGPMPSISRSSK